MGTHEMKVYYEFDWLVIV